MIVQVGYSDVYKLRVTPLGLGYDFAFEIYDGWLENELRLDALAYNHWLVRYFCFAILYAHRDLYLILPNLLRIKLNGKLIYFMGFHV